MVRTPRPTESELAILRVLWNKGPATVRQVNDELSRSRDTGYTTTLKLMQIMTDKGLVTRDERDRTHVYAARWTQGQTQHQLLSDLVDGAFGGSEAALFLQALSANPTSSAELAEIEQLIETHKRGKTMKSRKTSGDHHG